MNRIGSTGGHGGPVGPEPAPAEPAPGPHAATGLPSACPVLAASYEPKDVFSGSQAPRSSDKETRPRTKPEFLVLAFLLGISISFSVYSVCITFLLFLDYRRLPFLYYRPFTPIATLVLPVGIAFIALLSSSLLLLIPWSRSNRIIRNCAIVLFATQVAVVIFSMADALIFARNLSALLGVMAVGLFGFTRRPNDLASGSSSQSNSSRFGVTCTNRMLRPVALPPGWARLPTSRDSRLKPVS